MSGKLKAGVFGVALAMLITTIGSFTYAVPTSAAAPPRSKPLAPARLLDTRPGKPTIDGQYAGIGRAKAGSVTEIKVAGRAGIPKNASAAMLNLTAEFPKEGTYLTAYPCGTKPEASNLNIPQNDIRANNVFVKLSATGTVCIYTVHPTDIIVDVNGYVPANGSPKSLVPARLLDTRPGKPTIDGQYAGIGRAPANSIVEIKVAGRAGVPNNATAALLNLTAEFPKEGTYLTAYPCGSKPEASNLNIPQNDIRANNVFVKLSAKGTVCIYTVHPTDIIVDVNGYVPANGTPTSRSPARLLDTRPGKPTIDGRYAGIGRAPADSITEIKVAGRAGVPSDATAAYINLTAEFPSEGTYLTAYPCGTKPEASNLNIGQNDIRANSAYIKLSPRGTICIYTVHPTDIIVDINGYLGPPPPPAQCTVDGTVVFTSLTGGECKALTDIYQSTNGNKWTDRNGWMTPTDPCYWSGVYCQRGHVSSISLWENGLAGKLPPTIRYLKWLEGLHVFKNSIEAIPPEIGQLKNLASLSIDNNRLTTLPPEIGNLSNLTALSMGNNQWTKIPTQLEKLNSLTYLSIRASSLTKIPASIFKIRSLESLDLSTNQITSVPPAIGDLRNLVGISLQDNAINKLPARIGELENLERLTIYNNMLPYLPKTFGNLKKLESLLLGDNRLTKLPASFGDLESLAFVDLSSNDIAWLPTSIGKLASLEYLSLSYNELKKLPDEIGDLSTLKDLSVYANNLNALPTTFTKLTQLEELQLGANNLRGDITATFRPFRKANNLTRLVLSGNGCLRTTSTGIANWLTGLDPDWRSGC